MIFPSWLCRPAQPLTRTDLTEMETRLMTAVQDAVTRITAAVEEVKTRFGSVDDLKAKLATERALIEQLTGDMLKLVADEDAEDITQNAELAAAREATDAALADVREVPEKLDALSTELEQLGADEDLPPAA